MIDLHSHILPGIDDGAREWDDTLALLREAAEDGTRTIVATPHFHPGVYAPPGPEVRRLVEEARARARAEGIEIWIEPGHEVRGMAGIIPRVRSGEILTFPGGKYLLLELPSMEVPRYLDDLLFELEMGDVTPILAHPERNRGLAKEPERLAELIDRGVRTQVTGASLFGAYGPHAQEAAELFFRRGLVHLVASDGHVPLHRPPLLGAAREAVEVLIGAFRSRKIFEVNPRRVLDGTELETENLGREESAEDPLPSPQIGWWKRIFGGMKGEK